VETARMARFFRLSHRFFGCHFARSHFSALAAGQSHFQQPNTQTAYRLSHHTTQTHIDNIFTNAANFLQSESILGNLCIQIERIFVWGRLRNLFAQQKDRHSYSNDIEGEEEEEERDWNSKCAEYVQNSQ